MDLYHLCSLPSHTLIPNPTDCTLPTCTLFGTGTVNAASSTQGRRIKRTREHRVNMRGGLFNRNLGCSLGQLLQHELCDWNMTSVLLFLVLWCAENVLCCLPSRPHIVEAKLHPIWNCRPRKCQSLRASEYEYPCPPKTCSIC